MQRFYGSGIVSFSHRLRKKLNLSTYDGCVLVEIDLHQVWVAIDLRRHRSQPGLSAGNVAVSNLSRTLFAHRDTALEKAHCDDVGNVAFVKIAVVIFSTCPPEN
ncbi:hypothetical protein QE152_g30134 [Popillia japonica]|uniref:Uncharacterized protein n=1 Tax=Popillia japonica TaxID=7064 RepID=A0AAW1JFK2_POPJA